MFILIPYMRQGRLFLVFGRRNCCVEGNNLVHVTAKMQQQRTKAEHCLAVSKFAGMNVTYSVYEGVIGVEQGRDCHPVFSVQTWLGPVFLHVRSP